MSRLDLIGDKQFIFGIVLVAANKLDTLLEREMNPFGITSKQWFLLLVSSVLFEKAPTIKEAASAMGSSHQNVKQMALKLEQKGLVRLEKDPRDARATRLVPTEQSKLFWEKTQKKGEEFMDAVFENLDNDELKSARSTLQKILTNLGKLENGTEIKEDRL